MVRYLVLAFRLQQRGTIGRNCHHLEMNDCVKFSGIIPLQADEGLQYKVVAQQIILNTTSTYLPPSSACLLRRTRSKHILQQMFQETSSTTPSQRPSTVCSTCLPRESISLYGADWAMSPDWLSRYYYIL